MKKIVLLLLLLSLGLSVFCAPVSIQTAQRAAESFWAQMNGSKVSFVGSQTEFTEFYVFNNQIGGGFVLVSADDIAHPILGYSDKGSFRTDVQLPVNVRGWFKGISKEISSAVELGVQQSEEVREEWNSLLEGTPYPKRSTRAVSALLSTTWDQGKPYNNLCPADSNTDSYYGGRTVTGCVATAMAQVMKYWNYPTQGTGSNSYSSSYGTLSANFANTTYDWANMPNNLTNYSSSTQKTAVATLMYHCGISVNMQYDIAENGGSGAYTVVNYGNTPCAKNALVTYFKYKSTIQGLFKQNYTDTNWKNLLKADLDAGRPIMYSGASDEGGHSFVCDGYNNSDQFHFNWGWSGDCDGFFSLNAMTPGSTGGIGGGGYDFSEDQDAIIGIEPAGLTVEPSTLTFQSTGGSSTVSVKAGTASTSWSATSSANWLTFSPSTGAGSEAITSVTVNATENTGSSTRTATITFTQGTSMATLTVTQTDEGTESCVIYNEDIMADDSTGTNGIGSNIYYSTYFTKIAEKVNVTGNYTLDKITIADILNSATSGSIAIKVLSATNGAPSTTELYSANINISTINNALNQGQLQGGGTCYYGEYEHTLNSTINVTGPFFICVDFTGVGAGTGSTMSNVVCISNSQNNGQDNTAYIYSIYSGYTGWKLVSNFFSDIENVKFAIQAHICPSSTPATTLSVSPSSLSYTAAGETKTVTVTSNTSWTATSSASWLTISPASGSNNGTITAVATANTSTSQRTATITVSGTGVTAQTISVTQAGESGGETGDCIVLHEDRFNSPSIYTAQDNGGYVCGSNSYGDQAKAEYFELSGNYNITSIDFAYAIDGTSGSVTFKVWANNNGTPGSELASQTVTLSNLYSAATSQSGTMVGVYTWTLSSPVAISTNFFAGFDVSSATSYIGLLSTAQGSGYTNSCYELYNGSWIDIYTSWQELDISMYVLPTVCPTGTTPSYNLTVNPTSLSYTANGESKTINVTSNTSWTATSSASWLTVSPASGSNNGTITAVAAANTTSSQRTATITVTGGGITRTVSVTQAGVSYNLTVNPTSLSYTADGESKTVTVTSNTSWTATSSASWLTVSPASGSNNGTITAVAAANTSTQQRTATITVSGTSVSSQTISVTQAAAPTAINEEVAEGISVYPNPTSGMFTVGLGAIEGKATCQIINANGSIIETREVNADSNSEIVFDCDVNSGVYFVRIISGNNVWTERVVIER